jgi:protein TonB
LNHGTSQEAGRVLLSGSLASSLLGHLAALFLLAVLSLPPAGSQPPEFIELDLSLLELTTEGGGEGGGMPQARPAAGPARRLKPEQALLAPAKKPSKARPQQRPEPLQAAPERASQEAVDTCSTTPSRPQPAAAPEAPEACGPGATSSSGGGAAGCGSGGPGGPGTPGAGGIGDGLGPGVGSGLCGVPRDYLLALHSEIERHKTYPDRARRHGWEGEVRVRFVVERDGKVSGVKVISSSGCSVLDEAAAATLEQIERFPPLPASIQLSRLRLELPLVYRLTR